MVACYTVPLIWMALDKYCPDSLPPKLAALLDQERRRQQLAESGTYLMGVSEDFIAAGWRPPVADTMQRVV